METLKGILENLSFMVKEVTQLFESAMGIFEGKGKVDYEKLESRDDYIDNLKGIIENKCYSHILEAPSLEKQTLDYVKAINIINSNLERIADFSNNIINQSHYLTDLMFMQRYNYQEYATEILDSLNLLPKAIVSRNIKMALALCRSENTLDEFYRRDLIAIIEVLKKGQDTENLVTVSFVLRYLERIGDALLNIGEAIINAAVGEKLKIYQYEALEKTLSQEKSGEESREFLLSGVGETKSGSLIERVYEKPRNGDGSSESARAVIFKEGRARKILKERDNIELWRIIDPELPPRIYGFEQHGAYASILLENLQGITLQQIIISGTSAHIKEAFNNLLNKIEQIWTRTRSQKSVKVNYMEQLVDRLDDVYRVHPEFRKTDHQICDFISPSFEEQIQTVTELEQSINSSFTTLVHGDFNIDNILYDFKENAIHYIDLHRSDYSDYVQDVSVFMISNFRLPIFDTVSRNKIEQIIADFWTFSLEYSQKQEDSDFQARLALGLARSLVTSSRFTNDKKFAATMFLRARYLLTCLTEHHNKPWAEFKLPIDVLTV